MRNTLLTASCFTLTLLMWAATTSAAAPVIPACDGDRRPVGRAACVATGDRGWHEGSRWRLKDTKAPEIGGRTAQCRAEQVAGVKARDRLRVLMSNGFTITFTGRSDPAGWPLATMRLADGRDASAQLMSESIVHAWPNKTNRWCNPEKW